MLPNCRLLPIRRICRIGPICQMNLIRPIDLIRRIDLICRIGLIRPMNPIRPIGLICPIDLIGLIRPLISPERPSLLPPFFPTHRLRVTAPPFQHARPARSNQSRPAGEEFLHHPLLEQAGLVPFLFQRGQLRVHVREHLGDRRLLMFRLGPRELEPPES